MKSNPCIWEVHIIKNKCICSSLWCDKCLPSHMQNTKHEIISSLLHKKSTFTFQLESYWTFSSITCNSMTASNTQNQEPDNRSQKSESKTQGRPWALQEHVVSQTRTQLQTLTGLDKVFIEDYYHMTTKDENMDRIKLAHMLSFFSLNRRTPFCTSAFTSNMYMYICTH